MNYFVHLSHFHRYELLDSALMRSGRFDRIIQCKLPDLEGRKAIFVVLTRRMNLEQDVDLARYVTNFDVVYPTFIYGTLLLRYLNI